MAIRVGERYRVGRVIGQGSFCNVKLGKTSFQRRNELFNFYKKCNIYRF